MRFELAHRFLQHCLGSNPSRRPEVVSSSLEAKRPALVHVGFDTLYKGSHIPGSVYAGPASEPEGIAALKKTLKPMSRQKEIVLYCGCCPWEDCPNVRSAVATARAMGFKHIRSLYIPRSFQQDWVDKGLPTVKDSK